MNNDVVRSEVKDHREKNENRTDSEMNANVTR